jgi:hypothetical protein
MVLLSAPLAAAPPPVAHTANWAITDNLQAIGFSPRPVAFPGPASGRINSDLAFWGDMAVQGTYEGFRLIDITFPSRPREIINYEDCAPDSTAGNQGDITIYGNILVRSWNSNASTANPVRCDGDPVPGGFEGLHVFDISNKQDPDLVGSVDLPCGSHTQTAVPDPANDRLLVYNNSSDDSLACSGVEIIQVPLSNPAGATFLRLESSGDPVTGGGLPNFVTVNAPSSAAGLYGATGATFGPNLMEDGLDGQLVVVNGPSATPAGATPSQGCGPLVGFPAGAIAVVDRGPTGCSFLLKAQNAQAAGAIAMVVVNNVATAPIEMTGTDPAVTIPSVMVSQANGAIIKAGLPATANLAMNPLAPRACHDTGVILGNVMKAVCAGHDGFSVWSLDPADGGSLTDPAILYSRMLEEDVTIGHSGIFSTDGKVIVFGHEPGGGTNPRCAVTGTVLPGGLVQTDDMKSYFFFDTESGELLSKLVLPRPQAVSENCTIHNYNMVPLKKKSGKPRYVLVAGNYQAGISVVDFSDPRHPREIAYADPPPLVPEFDGGDWSTYWYNGRIYESDMTRGLTVWRLDDPAVATYLTTPFSNPQTQMVSID